MVPSRFGPGCIDPANRGADRHEKFWFAVSEYLRSAGWGLQQLQALRFPSPLPGPARI